MNKIFITRLAEPNYMGCSYGAVCEDGSLLGIHFCSNDSWAWQVDLSDRRNDRKEAYENYCPDGYELVNMADRLCPIEIKKEIGVDSTKPFIEIEFSE